MALSKYGITLDDLEAEVEQFLSLFDRDDDDTPDTLVVETLVTKAENYFEGFAANKYSLQELREQKPPFAKEAILNIVIYRAYLGAKRYKVPEERQKLYDRTMNLLESWGPPAMPISATESVAESQPIVSGNKDDSDLDDEISGLAYVI